MTDVEVGIFIDDSIVMKELFVEIERQSQYSFIENGDFSYKIFHRNNKLDIEINGNLSGSVGLPIKAGLFLDLFSDLIHEKEQNIIHIGRYIFDAMKGVIIKDEESIRLTEKEIKILSCLCAAKDYVMSKERLLKEVWGYDEGLDTHTLETHIYRLRQKIGDEEFIVNKDGCYELDV